MEGCLSEMQAFNSVHLDVQSTGPGVNVATGHSPSIPVLHLLTAPPQFGATSKRQEVQQCLSPSSDRYRSESNDTLALST